jgi:hypothetical protein
MGPRLSSSGAEDGIDPAATKGNLCSRYNPLVIDIPLQGTSWSRGEKDDSGTKVYHYKGNEMGTREN